MGVMGIPILLAPALGPVLAGWLVQYAVWRWIFLLNLPVGLLGLAIGLRSLPGIGRQGSAGLDLPGALLAPLAFAALSYGISQGGLSWTSPQTLGGLVVGSTALAALAVAELRARVPLLELRVFRSTEFCLAIVIQWTAQFALFGALFLVPFFLQQARGYGAFTTGLLLLPQALAAAIIMPLSGRLFDRIGARPLVLAGMALVAAATFLLARVSPATRGTDLILPLAMIGAGMGAMMMPPNTHLINAAPRSLVSRVTSLTNALQQVVNSLTIAGLTTILTARAALHISAARAAVAAPPAPLSSGGAPAGDGLRLAHDMQVAIASAYAAAFDDTFRLMVVAALAAGLLGLLLRSRATAGGDVREEAVREGIAMPS
jgi:EmrB/QacA subfamily drug resistance transporter